MKECTKKEEGLGSANTECSLRETSASAQGTADPRGSSSAGGAQHETQTCEQESTQEATSLVQVRIAVMLNTREAM